MALTLIRGSLQGAKFAPMTRLSHHAASKFQHALSQNTSDLTQLDNGITIATEKINSPAATVGIYLDGGSRHETKELNGITNFIEKLIFKNFNGGQSKKLQKDLHALGAQIGSITNRENSSVSLTVSPNNINKAFEILSQLVDSPSLSEEHIEATRKEVLDELNDKQNDYQQIVLDYLHSVAYQETGLAFSKFGTTANIERFTKSDIEKGIDLLFKPARMVVAASGDVDHKSILNAATKSFTSLKNTYESGIPSFPTSRYTGSDIRVRDDSVNGCHVAFVVEGPGYNSPDHLIFDIATSLAGKWDLTMGGGINVASYMGMVSAAEHLAQSFQGLNLLYRETSLYGGYFVGERLKLEDSLFHLLHFFKRQCIEVTNNEIAQGKNNLMTKLIRERETSASNALSLATDILRHGQRLTLEDWKVKIDRISSEKFREVSEKYVWDRCPTVSALGACENLPLYEEIRMKMTWIRY